MDEGLRIFMFTFVNLYLGDNIKNPNKYLDKLKNGKFINKFYIVAFNDGSNTLEIYPSFNFLQKYYRNLDLEIVAITKEESSAIEYIRKLSEISMKKYNDFKPRDTIYSLAKEEMDYLYKVIDEEEN